MLRSPEARVRRSFFMGVMFGFWLGDSYLNRNLPNLPIESTFMIENRFSACSQQRGRSLLIDISCFSTRPFRILSLIRHSAVSTDSTRHSRCANHASLHKSWSFVVAYFSFISEGFNSNFLYQTLIGMKYLPNSIASQSLRKPMLPGRSGVENMSL